MFWAEFWFEIGFIGRVSDVKFSSAAILLSWSLDASTLSCLVLLLSEVSDWQNCCVAEAMDHNLFSAFSTHSTHAEASFELWFLTSCSMPVSQ